MPLKVTKFNHETWRECTNRIARKNNMQLEVMEEYDYLIDKGRDEIDACWMALHEWDCLEYVEDRQRQRDREQKDNLDNGGKI